MGIFTLTHLPKIPKVPSHVPHTDKLVHVALFFGLVVLGHAARGWPAAKPTAASHRQWCGVYAAYAIVDEILQPFVGRTASVADWLADLLGIAAGSLLVALRGAGRTPLSRP